MELNKKQLELVENIFKNYNHCELGQAWSSTKVIT